MKKLLLMILISFSLAACTNTEVIHSPVDCLGQPSVSMELTPDEFKTIAPTAKKKIIIFVKTLRKRIDTQCRINHKHDEIHGD